MLNAEDRRSLLGVRDADAGAPAPSFSWPTPEGWSLDTIPFPLSYAPELPAQLLAGTADEPPPIDVYSRIKRVDNALQVFWFQEQLHRMGRGQEPDLELGRWGACWRGIRSSFLPIGRGARRAVTAQAVAA